MPACANLQVEHPVTEGITETNIPSIQLMVGMGIPLWRIPCIRNTFNKDPKGADFFDIETTPQRLPQKHVVAVRITSENAGDGFKPTAGRVDEVSSRSCAGTILYLLLRSKFTHAAWVHYVWVLCVQISCYMHCGHNLLLPLLQHAGCV